MIRDINVCHDFFVGEAKMCAAKINNAKKQLKLIAAFLAGIKIEFGSMKY